MGGDTDNKDLHSIASGDVWKDIRPTRSQPWKEEPLLFRVVVDLQVRELWHLGGGHTMIEAASCTEGDMPSWGQSLLWT